MVVITLQRDKCIGCNYCYELAPDIFVMSKKDGKSILLDSYNKCGFYTLKHKNNSIYNNCINAANACPVNIIKVKLI